MSVCKCLGRVTDIPCICEPYASEPDWLEGVLKRSREIVAKLPKALRQPSGETR